MNTLTKEWLQNTITSIESARDEIPFGLDEDQNNMLTALKIALASLAVVSDERAAYELFMEKRFGESVDRRRAKNGDREYMAWDMALGWIIWCHRAAMLQAGNFRENKGSSTNNFREISETSTNYPVTPDGWISCSERMPEETGDIIVVSDGIVMSGISYSRRDGFYMAALEYDDDEPIGGVTHWMPLPEPPRLKEL
ncbi:TPA: DUF551 domain-containing protein [Escherichia coli]|nr:DUF551 domain-containing protein [Escherichia coli]